MNGFLSVSIVSKNLLWTFRQLGAPLLPPYVFPIYRCTCQSGPNLHPATHVSAYIICFVPALIIFNRWWLTRPSMWATSVCHLWMAHQVCLSECYFYHAAPFCCTGHFFGFFFMTPEWLISSVKSVMGFHYLVELSASLSANVFNTETKITTSPSTTLQGQSLMCRDCEFMCSHALLCMHTHGVSGHRRMSHKGHEKVRLSFQTGCLTAIIQGEMRC